MSTQGVDCVDARRHFDNGRYDRDSDFHSPQHPQHLPAAEPVYPGHTLIKPARGHLKSAIKYPLRDVKNTLVYGNPSNIGIMYGKVNDRVMYSDFRRDRRTEDLLLNGLAQMLLDKRRKSIQLEKTQLVEENDAREILDRMDPQLSDYRYDLRRKSHHREREKSESESVEADSASDEKNPGNPFTVYGDKYKKNWLWNHFMDGSHVNINPYGPEFKNLGPSGVDLFLGRKWWYFNQDDYKPMN